MQEEILRIENDAIKNIGDVKNIGELNKLKIEYLGKKGKLTALLRNMGNISVEDRPIIGSMINKTRETLEDMFNKKEKLFEINILNERLKQEDIDVTIPSKKNKLGSLHPITQIIDNIKEIFIGLGYSIEDGPEIEKTYYVFDKLNTPKDHPARDIQDTFYITDDIVLRSHTSSVQIRAMEKQTPPIKIICPGTVYRSDSVDSTHSPVFHQIEGLVIDKNITMSDLKGTLEVFAKKCLGEKTLVRFRPHYFAYTEPSAEVDVSCFVCNGKGCRVCKNEGWIELLGCGMVHPDVLKGCNIDPTIYSGFAFGCGVERIAMAKFGIEDMRLFFENDVRFLKQF